MKECQNCGFDVTHGHPEHACLLHALVQYCTDTDAETIDRLYTHTDVSALWRDVTPIIESLQGGWYELDD